MERRRICTLLHSRGAARALSHSVFNTTSGSMAVERRAGTMAAATPTRARTPATVTNTAESCGDV